jgi:hypothetical protein
MSRKPPRGNDLRYGSIRMRALLALFNNRPR